MKKAVSLKLCKYRNYLFLYLWFQKLPLPTTDYIEKKFNDIVAALNFQYSDEDVQKVQEYGDGII